MRAYEDKIRRLLLIVLFVFSLTMLVLSINIYAYRYHKAVEQESSNLEKKERLLKRFSIAFSEMKKLSQEIKVSENPKIEILELIEKLQRIYKNAKIEFNPERSDTLESYTIKIQSQTINFQEFLDILEKLENTQTPVVIIKSYKIKKDKEMLLYEVDFTASLPKQSLIKH
ncbi:hypothetical protein [Thermodesulfovibrio hydrogeniphilus]